MEVVDGPSTRKAVGIKTALPLPTSDTLVLLSVVLPRIFSPTLDTNGIHGLLRFAFLAQMTDEASSGGGV